MARKKKTVSVSVFQQGFERLLACLAAALGLYHIISTFFAYAYTWPIRTGRTVLRWSVVGLLGLCAVYLVYAFCWHPETLNRVKSFIKRFFNKSQLLLVALLVLFIISCAVNGTFKGNDRYLLDLFICALVLFPLPMLFRGTRVVEIMLHVLMAVATVFMLWVLVVVFRREVAELPGGQVGMTAQISLMIACNVNTTGAFGALLFMLSLTMMLLVPKYWKIPYAAAALIHLLVLYLANSRTAFLSVLPALMLLVFMIAHRRGLRLPVSIGLAVAAGVLYYFGRELAFWLHENVTHLRYLLSLQDGKERNGARALNTGLSGRLALWDGALRAIVSDMKTFLIGVTVTKVEPAIRAAGHNVESKSFSYAHNEFLQIGLAMGVPALAVFVTWLIGLVRKSLSMLFHGHRLYMVPAVVLMLVTANMTESYLVAYNYFCGCVFFLLCGMINAAEE